MATNAVAPWEGELSWIGEFKSGKTNSGAEWKSVEFALKYTDSQMNEKEIVFSLYGAGKVSSFREYKVGDWLKVVWWPEANQYNGRYYSKNSVIAVYKIDSPAKSADAKITAPSYPTPQPPLPTNPDNDDLPDDDSGLPF